MLAYNRRTYFLIGILLTMLNNRSTEVLEGTAMLYANEKKKVNKVRMGEGRLSGHNKNVALNVRV